MKSGSFFVLWPYFALTMLVAGTLIRYVATARRPSTVRDEVSEAWAIFRGSWLWRVSLVILLAAHLAALVMPQAILRWNNVGTRLYLMEGLLFLAGSAAVVSGAVLVWKYLGRGELSFISSLFDAIFLSFLMVAIVSGVLLAVFYRWGSTWGAMVLAPYVSSVIRGEPAIELLSQTPFLARLHVLSSFAALAVVPFSRLAALPVGALHGCVTIASRVCSGTAGAAEAWFRKHNLGTWLWPEED